MNDKGIRSSGGSTTIELQRVLDRLKTRYQCEFIVANGSLSQQMARAVIIDEEQLKLYHSGKLPAEKLENVLPINHDPDKKYKEVIIVDLTELSNSGINVNTIGIIIAHEFGHIKTYDQLTDADLDDYYVKSRTLKYIQDKLDPSLGDAMAYVYFSLKVERLANQYAGIPLEQAATIILGAPKISGWKNIPAMNLVNMKIDPEIPELLQSTITYGSKKDAHRAKKVLLFYKEVYEKCLSIEAQKKNLPYVINELNNIEEGKFTTESVIVEDVLDDMKPESDNPIQDTMLDLDRKLSGIQQSMKSRVQGVQRTASAIAKPFKRTSQWITNMVTRWKDANENDIKAKMADPHERSTLLSAFKSAIKYGSLMKAGLLLNPIIMFLTISKKWSDRKNTFRIRNEMIGELKAELEIIEEKIKDADQAQDRAAKYKLMRFRNELKKKLIRVGGTPEMKNMI